MKVNFGLSSREIGQAIRQIEEYKKDLEIKCRLLAERLASDGVFICRTKIAEHNAVYSGELLQSIEIEYQGSTMTGARFVIKTGVPYAAFVEFGTGIVGSNNPHPLAGITSWKYDVNEHGEKGWIYTDENRVSHWTKGMQSRPFMWETANELRLKINDVAREVFK